MNTLLGFNPLLIAVILLAIVVLVLIGIVIHLHRKLSRFLIGIDAKNIGDSLSYAWNEVEALKKFRDELEAYLATVEKRLRKSVQSVHTVRFNPFKGAGGGGNQSFATAFLTEEGDGVVVSSLYARDHVSVFAKPVKRHASEHGLSEEEREALENAKKGLK
jgi:hypothetical protein